MFTFNPSGNDQFLNERGLECLTLAPNGVGISYSISFMPSVRLQTGCFSRPTPPILLFFPFGSGEFKVFNSMKFLIVLLYLVVLINKSYSQCVSGDCKNGEGTYVYSNAIYWGHWVDGMRDGFGYYQYDGQQIYEGNWLKDKKHGFGNYYWNTGDSYEGNWINDKKSGQATYYFNNGDRFVGIFSDNNITENGITTRKVIPKLCISGDCYNGFGKFGFTNAVYEGYFKGGKQHGKGKMTYSSKNEYDGLWENGEKNGKGKMRWYSGDTYDGEWIGNKKHGKGSFTWGKGKWDGDKYEGDWYEDERTGWGVYTSKNGTIQEGNFEKGIYKGKEIQRAVASTNTTTSTQNNNVEQSEIQTCNIKFSKPSGLTVKFTDNRKVCCYCEKYYAKNNLNPDAKLWDEAQYLSENLYLHFIEVKANEKHKEEDIKKLSEFINLTYKDPFMALIPAMTSLIPLTYALSALTGEKREIGSKLRYVDQYKIASKFCTNECETKCEYYGCKTCK